MKKVFIKKGAPGEPHELHIDGKVKFLPNCPETDKILSKYLYKNTESN